MKKYVLLTALATMCTAALYTGCTTNIRPIEPVRRVVMWVPDAPATEAATGPATEAATERSTAVASTAPVGSTTQVAAGKAIPELAPLLTTTEPFEAKTQPGTRPATRPGKGEVATTEAGTEPSTQPGHRGEHLVVKVIDPNQTSRYLYHGTYDNIWQQSMKLLVDMGFTLDRKDYRLGILTTAALPSAQVVEPWKPQQTTFKNALENTINTQRRTVRITISTVPEKPEFYEIAVQVMVEREYNPLETIGGPVFVRGSGFGESQVSLRSDYAPAETKGIGEGWYVLGHDPNLEHKVLRELFKHI